jgi:(p)ppGpp synthase/HD superfamily hydrolase
MNSKMNSKTLDYWINLMRQIAVEAHKGQYRRDGRTSYINHILDVAGRVEDRLKPIALGHDLIEDTTVSLQDLRDAGFPSYIVDAIEVLTHVSSEPNVIYWKKILQNEDAVRVKLADIQSNLEDAPTEHQRTKYQKALQLFADAGYTL